VGPLRIEIIEPMRLLRLVLEDDEFGFTLDITCRSVTVPYEDPAEVTRIDGRLISERMTYETTGKCEGWVRVGDILPRSTRRTGRCLRAASRRRPTSSLVRSADTRGPLTVVARSCGRVTPGPYCFLKLRYWPRGAR